VNLLYLAIFHTGVNNV